MSSDEFEVDMGQLGDRSARYGRGHRRRGEAGSLVGQVLTVLRRTGATPLAPARRNGGKPVGTGPQARGRTARLHVNTAPLQRRVVIKARVIRHRGARFRSTPVAGHVAYLERDGVTRDQQKGRLFGADGDEADGEAFASRCTDDRHHFRFIVSPEDATELTDLRTFTRELMQDMAHDLGTALDWVAVDHWNTDNPHVHVLVRGKAADGADLVIDREYISQTLRSRAEERVTVELGPRTEREIRSALVREISAERWTSLDRQLHELQDRQGTIDLRPSSDDDRRLHSCLVGRANVLGRMGLADEIQPGQWRMHSDAQQVLRDMEERGDIIKSIHRAMSGRGWAAEPSRIAIHNAPPDGPVIGRLAARGFDDELSGSAYAVVDGVDGRTHRLRFSSVDATGDTPIGGIVELHQWKDRSGRQRCELIGHSDLSLADQVTAPGATWLDQQLVADEPAELGAGFGRDVAQALRQRGSQLFRDGLVTGIPGQIRFPDNLLDTLYHRDLDAAAQTIATATGMERQPSGLGDHVAGTYRQRLDLASGRFALIDNGLGFQLVPWQRELDRRLGRSLSGVINQHGDVEWSFERRRSLER